MWLLPTVLPTVWMGCHTVFLTGLSTSLLTGLLTVHWNDINVVVEQPFGKHFGERMFDFLQCVAAIG
jgi:hypothetical protein